MTWLDCLDLRVEYLEQRTGLLDALGSFFEMTWEWLTAMRASNPALEIIQYGYGPEDVRLEEVIQGRRPSGRRRRFGHEYDIFYHWDIAAYHRRDRGFAGFAEVMREGSEKFAMERFSEPANGGSR